MLSFLFLGSNVNAESYDLSFKAYRANNCNDYYDCMVDALTGAMDNYEIKDGLIEANDTIMILPFINPSSDSRIIVLQAIIKTDSTKLVRLDDYVLNDDFKTLIHFICHRDFPCAA